MIERDPELEALDPELDDLLTAERSDPGLPESTLTRLLCRLETTAITLAGTPPPDTIPPPRSGGPSDTAPTLPRMDPAAGAAASSSAGAASGAGAVSGAGAGAGAGAGVVGAGAAVSTAGLLGAAAGPLLAVGLTAFLVGGSIGFGLGRGTAPTAPPAAATAAGAPATGATDGGIPDDLLPPLPAPPAVVPRPDAAAAAATPSDEVVPLEMPAELPAARRRARGTASSRRDGGEPGEHDADLARERNLLETARTALLRRDPQAARTALERHQARYRRGRLREERQALMVQAMAMAGQAARARALAAEFRRLYPQSLLLPLVEGSIRGL